MRVVTAQLPGPEESDDRIFVTENAVIVLDGASAFMPVPVSAAKYVDALGLALSSYLQQDPAADLQDSLAVAIEQTAISLDLAPGNAPSSTVAVARLNDDQTWDLLVLGDSLILGPDIHMSDDRQAKLGREIRRAYQDRLRAGSGFDREHRRLLYELQVEQAKWRNKTGGYWVAEADPGAASHAARQTGCWPWLALMTDGVYKALDVDAVNWSELLSADGEQESRLLAKATACEATDSMGKKRPRAKCHDDKALAIVRPGGPNRDSPN